MPTATPFSNLITFSRGSNATVTGPNGLIQWAPNNLPTFSEQFDNVNWPKENITVIANTAIAPDGSSTAELMYPTTTGNNRRIIRSTTLTVGTVYAQSVYVKAAGKRWVYLNGIDATTAANNCWFDLQDGVVGTKGGSVLSAGISAVGDGWYRIFTVALAGANNYFYLMGVDGDNTITSTTNGTDGILIWGAQLELGSTATTYNPTTVKNLISFSEAFDNAGWTKGNASVVTGAQANPINGLFNAQKLMENTANAQHLLSQNYVAGAGIYTYSIYVKAAERDIFGFNRTDIGGFSASYNLTTGTVRSISGFTNAQIIPVGGGWYRVSCMLTLAAGTTIGFGVQPYNAVGSTVYTGDGNSGLYIYGAQLSDSASLDPYVPAPGLTASSTAFYGPRFDFDPVTLQPRGLLVEEQRTNLALRSEEFNDAAWGVSGLTVTANTAIAPTGATTADTITGNSAAGAVIFPSGLGVSASATSYTASCYVKPGSAAWIVLSLWQGSGTSGVNVWFNAQTGAVGSNNATAGYVFTSASSTAVGNGWYRITVTGTVPAAALFWSLRLVDSDNAFVYTNTVGDTMFVWGAQLEAGAFATSYIPTVASTVTRSADVALISGQNFAQWYGPATGTFVAEYQAVAGVSMDIAMTSDGSPLTNSLGIFSSNGTSDVGWCRTGGVNQALITASSTATTPHKTAFAYEVNNFGFSAAGSAAGTDTSGTIPTVNIIRLGSIVGGGVSGNTQAFWFRSFNFIPARAADFQLQALTAQSIVDYFYLQTAAGDQLVAGNDDYLYSLPILG